MSNICLVHNCGTDVGEYMKMCHIHHTNLAAIRSHYDSRVADEVQRHYQKLDDLFLDFNLRLDAFYSGETLYAL